MQRGPDQVPVSNVSILVGPPIKGPAPVPVTTTVTEISPPKYEPGPTLIDQENNVIVDIPYVVAVANNGEIVTNKATLLDFVGTELIVNSIKGNVTITLPNAVIIPSDGSDSTVGNIAGGTGGNAITPGGAGGSGSGTGIGGFGGFSQLIGGAGGDGGAQGAGGTGGGTNNTGGAGGDAGGGNNPGGSGGAANAAGGDGGAGSGTGSGGAGGDSGSAGGDGGESGNGNPGGQGGSVTTGGGEGGTNAGPGAGGGVGINGGNSGSGAPGGGISVPGGGSGEDLSISNPGGAVSIGDPESPGISVPSNPNQPIQLGNNDQNAELFTGLAVWELIYTGIDGKLDSSEYITVTPDADDIEGKSLNLHAGTYDTGGGTKKQATLYFIDPTSTSESDRAASIRYVNQALGRGIINSPWENFDDGAFHSKGGVAVWRATYGGLPATKVTLNDDAVGPSIHGLYLGSVAMSFFQNLAGGSSPNTAGLTYIVIPGIPDGSGVNKIGQIFANPYRNRSEDGLSGIPYYGLGWKLSTQIGSQSTIEAAELVPGNEVLTWHTTNRVGIMNTDPNWTLSVTGDVAFTNTLRVGNAENPGSTGQALISTGASTAPEWRTIGDSLYDAGTLSGAITLNRNNGTIQKVRLNGNVTSLAISNMAVAQSFTIIFTQDEIGDRTLTTSSSFKFASGYKTLSTGGGAVDMLNIFYDGTVYYCTLTTGYA